MNFLRSCGKAFHGILPMFEAAKHNHMSSHVLASIQVAAKIESTYNLSQSSATMQNVCDVFHHLGD